MYFQVNLYPKDPYPQAKKMTDPKLRNYEGKGTHFRNIQNRGIVYEIILP